MVLNHKVVGVVVELPIQSGTIKRHVDSLLPHRDDPSDADLFEVVARVVPHDHSFPLIEGVRDDDRFPGIATMVDCLRDVNPIGKVVPIHLSIVDGNRRIPLGMKSMERVNHAEDVLEPAAFLGSDTEVDVEQRRVGEGVDEGENAGEDGHHMIGGATHH